MALSAPANADLNQGVFTIPKILDHYQLIEEVGNGGLGKVFKALDMRSQKIVAIKILHQKYYNDERLLGIFHRELMIMASLNHKHIVSYLFSNFKPPIYYVVTEFVDGWSGYQFLKKVKKVPPLVAVCILMDMMQGIDHLHLHDIIHADLSSANYLINKSGRIFVADFGLACVQDVEDYRNHIIGTPGYHAPEHLTDSGISQQSDIYCAGILFYELLVGKKPVPAHKDRKIVIKAMKRIDFGAIASKDRRLQNMVRKLSKKMLEFKMSRRIHTAEEVLLGCYVILKAYNIRYTRYAIKQYLIDLGLSSSTLEGGTQDIYQGWGS